jgi:hypothetical protein
VTLQVYATIVFPVLFAACSIVLNHDGTTEVFTAVKPWTWGLLVVLGLFQIAVLYVLSLRWKDAPSYFDFVQARGEADAQIDALTRRQMRSQSAFRQTLRNVP